MRLAPNVPDRVGTGVLAYLQPSSSFRMGHTVDSVALSNLVPEIDIIRSIPSTKPFGRDDAAKGQLDDDRRKDPDYQSFQSYLQQNQSEPVQRVHARTPERSDSKVSSRRSSSNEAEVTADRKQLAETRASESQRAAKQSEDDDAQTQTLKDAASEANQQKSEAESANSDPIAADSRQPQTQSTDSTPEPDIPDEQASPYASPQAFSSTARVPVLQSADSLLLQNQDTQSDQPLVSDTSGQLSTAELELSQTDAVDNVQPASTVDNAPIVVIPVSEADLQQTSGAAASFSQLPAGTSEPSGATATENAERQSTLLETKAQSKSAEVSVDSQASVQSPDTQNLQPATVDDGGNSSTYALAPETVKQAGNETPVSLTEVSSADREAASNTISDATSERDSADDRDGRSRDLSATGTSLTRPDRKDSFSQARQRLIDSMANSATTDTTQASGSAIAFATESGSVLPSEQPTSSQVSATAATSAAQASSLQVTSSRIERPTPLLQQVLTAVTENANTDEPSKTITVNLRDPHIGELRIQLERHENNFAVRVAAGDEVTFAMLSSRSGELTEQLRANDIQLQEITQIDANSTGNSAFSQPNSENRDQRSPDHIQQQTRRFSNTQKGSHAGSTESDSTTASTVSFRA